MEDIRLELFIDFGVRDTLYMHLLASPLHRVVLVFPFFRDVFHNVFNLGEYVLSTFSNNSKIVINPFGGLLLLSAVQFRNFTFTNKAGVTSNL